MRRFIPLPWPSTARPSRQAAGVSRPPMLRRLRAAIPLSAMLVLASSAPLVTACDLSPTDPGSGSSCCKVCKEGKACGDSCIARNRTCTKGSGCACNG
ncbi:MAG TPA: hypothetical protein VGB66_17730 [Longimicrobium sp.]